MSWINNFLLGLLSAAFAYCLLVFGDWYIKKNLTQQLDSNPEYLKAMKIMEMRKKNEDVPFKSLAYEQGFNPGVFPALMDRLNFDYPLIAGVPNTNVVLCNEGYGLIKYRTDRFGFRNNDRDWDSKSKSIMIGDSFVHGACVADDQTLSSVVATNTNHIVLNLGTGSNGPSHYLAYGELFIPKIRPKNVYLIFYANDNGIKSPSLLEKVYVDKQRKLFSNTGLQLFDTEFFIREGHRAIDIVRKEDLNAQNKIKKNLFTRVKDNFSNHYNLPMIKGLILPSSANFKNTKKAISSAFNLCDTFECNLKVVYIPNSKFWAPDSRADQYGDNIIEFANTLNIHAIDGRDILDRTEGSKDYAIKGFHLSPVGYKKLATFIASTYIIND